MRYSLLTLLLAITALILLWPNFHPEQVVLKHYYWQADVLIHTGYFFGLTLLIAFLKLPVKPFYLFLGLGLFSIALEGLQVFSSKRGVSVMDAVDNVVGIGLALVLYQWMIKKKRSAQQRSNTTN